MDLSKFGQRLREFRKQRDWGRTQLANELDKIAASGSEEEYRVIDNVLIGKWERAYQQRRPTHSYVIYLIKLFRPQLDLSQALAWADQAGYQLGSEDLIGIFPATLFKSPPLPQLDVTLSRLEPPPLHQLFGVEEIQVKLGEALKQPDDHWILSIEGNGGIGKTSLASSLLQDILETNRFYDVAWLSAKQQEFVPDQGIQHLNRPVFEVGTFTDRLLGQLDPTLSLVRSQEEKSTILTHWLKTYPYLVVIDNLETVRDYQTLMPVLRRLARPTKFLLTSREHIQEDIYSHSLKELSRPITIEFLQYMGERKNLSPLMQASESQLNEIYDVVGGNPLALKLVIGQLHMGLYGLTTMLGNLKNAQGKTINELYTFIYRQAWQHLDEATRRLFVLMPQIPQATAEDLARKSKLIDEDLTKAIHQLVTLSLVEVRADLDEPYYYLHRLTETFLLNDVIQWKSLI